MTDLHDETVTVVSVVDGPPDDDGVPTTVATTQDIVGCNVQPVGTTESVGLTDLVTSRWRVSTTSPQDWVQSNGTVVWRGGTYQIDGHAQTYWSALPHTEFVIIQMKG